jgi:transposase
MARGYSNDLRVRVIEFVETGESAREAARCFAIGISTAIRWVQRWKQSGSVAAKPRHRPQPVASEAT